MGRIALFAVGIWLGVEQRALLPPPVLLLILVCTAALWSVLRGVFVRAVCIALLGFVWLGGHGHWRLSDRLPAPLHRADLLCEGRLIDPTELAAGRWRMLWQVQRCQLPRPSGSAALGEGGALEWQPLPLKVRLAWYRPPPVAPPRGGEQWRFKLRLKQPRGHMNPHGFDYETWLFQRGVHATAYVREPELARRLAPAPWWSLAGARERLRQRLQAQLPQHPYAGVIAALVLADRSAIEPELWQRFRDAGTGHLLAISGLHVGLVAAFGALLGRVCWRLGGPGPGRRAVWMGLSSVLCAAAYAAMAGFALPTTRALLMLLVAVCSLLQGRHRSAFDTLSVAFLALLLLDPLAVLSAGFWLSFGSVAGIVMGLSGKGHWRRWQQLLWVNAAMGLVLAPLSYALFAQLSWWCSAANLLAVPVFSLIVVPMSLLGAGLALTPLPGATAVLAVACEAIAWCDAWQALLLRLPTPDLALVGWAPLGLLIVSVLLLAPRLWRGSAALAVAAVVLLLSPRPLTLPPGGFSVSTLDVGHGLAVLVHTRGHVLVYDTGDAYSGARTVLSALRGTGWTVPDRLLVSHTDQDHAGGLAELQRQFVARPPLLLFGSNCRDGRRWEWDGVRFELLHPARQWGADNDNSCVLRISSQYGSALLPGDIEAPAERAMLQRGAQLRSDLLLLPHHGSKSSSSEQWLAQVAPRLAVVSVDKDSRWGMPHRPVLERLAALQVRTLSTGDSGAIIVRFDGSDASPQVQQTRLLRRRFWHLP